MSQRARVVPAAIAVLVLALTLGLATSFVTSSDAEAASQPSPVATASVVDQDSCTTFSYGYPGWPSPFYSGIYGPGVMPYGGVYAYQCVSPAACIGTAYLYYLQPALICPGPPATIELQHANSVTCASASNITAKVRDANGLNVLDGTAVSFGVSPFAQITGSVETNGGEATASLTTPTKTMGTLNLTVTAGGVTRNASINVSCNAPGSVQYGASTTTTTIIYVYPDGSPAPAPMGGGAMGGGPMGGPGY